MERHDGAWYRTRTRSGGRAESRLTCAASAPPYLHRGRMVRRERPACCVARACRVSPSRAPQRPNRIIVGPWSRRTGSGRGDGDALGELRFGSASRSCFPRQRQNSLSSVTTSRAARSRSPAPMFRDGEPIDRRTFASWPLRRQMKPPSALLSCRAAKHVIRGTGGTAIPGKS